MHDCIINAIKLFKLSMFIVGQDLSGGSRDKSSHPVDFSVSFMGRTLTPVDSARDLVVIMDSYLTYDNHISCLVSSCLSKVVQIN